MSGNPPAAGTSRPIQLLSLNRRHRSLVLYGLVQAGAAMIVTATAGLTSERITLFLDDGRPLVSHSPAIAWTIALLLISAMTYALAGATRGPLWLRLLAATVVSGLLLLFGWGLGALPWVALPTAIAFAYPLWRGSHPVPDTPGWKDLFILAAIVSSAWCLAVAFGLRPEGYGVVGGLYFGAAQLLAFAAFLPMTLLLLSGLDLAELAKTAGGLLSDACSRASHWAVPLTLFGVSAAKAGFYVWRGEWGQPGSWNALALFAVVFVGITLRAPARWLAFTPQFKHWLVLTGIVLVVPVGAVAAIALGKGAIGTESAGPLLIGSLGPMWLAFAGLMALRPQGRPFALFTALLGSWVLLSIGLAPLSQLAFGRSLPGIGLRELDVGTALLFLTWSVVLLVRGKSSPLAPTALTVTFFLSCGFVLDQLLNRDIKVAELYTVLQALSFLIVRQVVARPKRAWLRVLPWLVIAVMIVHSLWDSAIPDGAMQMVKFAILTIAVVWDMLMSEERLGGAERMGAERPARLFLYLGVLTWAIAQLVFAEGGEGAEEFEMEPLLLFGFLIIGTPRVFHLFMAEIRDKLHPERRQL